MRAIYVAVAPGCDPQPVREFGSWTADLERMAEWLKVCGIEMVVMQSTGVYWMALWRHPGGAEVQDLPDKCAPHQGTCPDARATCTGKPMVVEVAHLRFVTGFISPTRRDPRPA